MNLTDTMFICICCCFVPYFVFDRAFIRNTKDTHVVTTWVKLIDINRFPKEGSNENGILLIFPFHDNHQNEEAYVDDVSRTLSINQSDYNRILFHILTYVAALHLRSREFSSRQVSIMMKIMSILNVINEVRLVHV